MGRKITINPITRLEGHGIIDVFLNKDDGVDRAYFRVPELRGFEKFTEGRLAEEMPQITQRICGVCPTAHHMAATKALDYLYQVEPPAAAKKIREFIYNVFMVEDHALHFFFLGGPDFVVGPKAPKSERNILGVLKIVGMEVGKKVINMRRELRELITMMGGKVIHPVCGLPGGVSKAMTDAEQRQAVAVADRAVEFAEFSMGILDDVILKNKEYVDIITSDAYTHKTYYMGLVDKNNKVNFYDGMLRVVDPDGKEFAKFPADRYLDYVAEHVEPWSFIKFCYLKPVGWKGFVGGKDSGVYAVAPLARLNAAEGMATPKAQAAYEKYLEVLGGKPVHFTLATHWARLIELMQAAESIALLARDPEIVAPHVRELPSTTPKEGFGVVEAPRGTLFHHYQTDDQGVITKANLIVATQNNAARIAMSVDKAAKGLIKNGKGKIDEGLLNMVEMAFRAYDPCHGCACHSLPGEIALKALIHDATGEVIEEIMRP